jgi:beta-1,4-mannosyl-glycoprotein beta-1,4-N-acetylglucosaminyltransferase
MYFDEDIILDLRLHILNQHVKKFVVTESTFTHNGKRIKLKFDINNFKKFKDKINYVVVDKNPIDIEEVYKSDTIEVSNSKILGNALKRENFQRNKISQGLGDALEDDFIIISDVDEIPNLDNINLKKKINIFEQSMFYYKFNLKQPNLKWLGSRACKKKYMISPQWLRNIKDKSYPFWRLDVLFSRVKYFDVNIIKKGGWHFSSVKSPEDIAHKLSSFLHHLEYEESGMNIELLKNKIKDKKVLYDHSTDKKLNKWQSNISLIKTSDDELPSYITKNREKFIDWLE